MVSLAKRENFHTTQLFQSFQNVISWRFPALLDIFSISDLENYGTNCSIAMRHIFLLPSIQLTINHVISILHSIYMVGVPFCRLSRGHRRHDVTGSQHTSSFTQSGAPRKRARESVGRYARNGSFLKFILEEKLNSIPSFT